MLRQAATRCGHARSQAAPDQRFFVAITAIHGIQRNFVSRRGWICSSHLIFYSLKTVVKRNCVDHYTSQLSDSTTSVK